MKRIFSTPLGIAGSVEPDQDQSAGVSPRPLTVAATTSPVVGSSDDGVGRKAALDAAAQVRGVREAQGAVGLDARHESDAVGVADQREAACQ